jgi:hypothetical protein
MTRQLEFLGVLMYWDHTDDGSYSQYLQLRITVSASHYHLVHLCVCVCVCVCVHIWYKMLTAGNSGYRVYCITF